MPNTMERTQGSAHKPITALTQLRLRLWARSTVAARWLPVRALADAGRHTAHHLKSATALLDRPALAGTLALALVALAAVAVAAVHLVPDPVLGPVATTISAYFHAAGGPLFLTVGLVALAASVAAVLVGLRSAGIRPCRLSSWALLAWAGALVLLAVFPTDAVGAPWTAVGVVHAVVSVSLFFSMPVGGWALARRLEPVPGWAGTSRQLRFLALGSGVAVLVFLLSYLPVFGIPSPFDTAFATGQIYGLTERVLVGLEAAVPVVLAVRLVRRGAGPVR